MKINLYLLNEQKVKSVALFMYFLNFSGHIKTN